MKVSYNWLKDYIDPELSPVKLGELLTDCGLEVEGIEKYEQIEGGLEGLVVGEVVACEKHPNADKLKLTQVNVGEEQNLPIVCGAPNVATGQKVIVARVNATIHPLNGDSFKIKKAKIRGEVSEGMICAEDEIGLGESHDGIMVLDTKAVVGSPAADYFQLDSDYTIEIGLTPNRADAMSHFGVARDILAVLKSKGAKQKNLSLKQAHPNTFPKKEGNLEIKLSVENPEACPRYAGLCFDNIEVKASPSWIQNRLKAIGLKPINNVVDVTNFVLHDFGQPLHAFDYDAIKNQHVVVRTAKAGTKFVTLDEQERSMDPMDLMICNDSDAMCIAGVFGGLHSGVSEKTTRIFLESAYFDPVFVRKTAKRQGLNTDASFRFERGIDPNITTDALAMASHLLVKYAGARLASDLQEFYPTPLKNFKVDFNIDNCYRMIGHDIPEQTILDIFENLDIEILERNGSDFKLEVPVYRVDVQREADLIEEILRIYGYNNIALPNKIKLSINPAPKVDQESIKNRIADLMVANGFVESMSNSLNSDAPYSESEKERLVKILNPLSSELNVMRKEMVYDALKNITHNQNHKSKDLKFFEFGKVYAKNETIEEAQVLSIAICGSWDEEVWNGPGRNSDLYLLKSVLGKIVSSLGLSSTLNKTSRNEDALFKMGQNILHKKNSVLRFGELNDDLLKKFDTKGPVFYAELKWDYLMKLCLNHEISVHDIPKYQEVRRDLALLLDKAVSFDQLQKLAFQTEQKMLREVSLFDVYEGKNLPSGKKSYALNYILRDDSKTLTDEKVDKVIKRIFEKYQTEFKAELRSGEL